MDVINQNIAKALKELRRDRGWSLDVASDRTGVSKAMLGQIERGESSPTIAVLWKIVRGFHVSFSHFIEAEKDGDASWVHRVGDLQQLHPQDDQIRMTTAFTYDADLDFEAFIIELLSGCEHLSPPHDQGVVEHIIVASGEMEVFLDGHWHVLGQHESFRFHANRVHGYANRSDKPAVFHVMVHYQLAFRDRDT